ncbi:MAG: hypothetical protein GX117_02230 [Candidatus Hydrogenedentes bacterium]|nr:hypothetical protein [Candidatus Hydrogenedentota bacterium]
MRLILLTALFFTMGILNACAEEADEQHTLPPFGEHIPEGYNLVYETNFSDDAVMQDFALSDPSSWRLVGEGQDRCLELFKIKGAYEPPVRSPHAIALLTRFMVEDFILEVDVESTNLRAGAHRDTCYFLGFTDPSKFYYVHIAGGADPHAHNVFLVNDAPRTNIASFTTKGIHWDVQICHRVRIERTAERGGGAIRVYFDNMDEPIMTAQDTTFGMGYIGIGSFDDTARFYGLRLYAPTTQRGDFSFFDKSE